MHPDHVVKKNMHYDLEKITLALNPILEQGQSIRAVSGIYQVLYTTLHNRISRTPIASTKIDRNLSLQSQERLLVKCFWAITEDPVVGQIQDHLANTKSKTMPCQSVKGKSKKIFVPPLKKKQAHKTLCPTAISQSRSKFDNFCVTSYKWCQLCSFCDKS